MPTLEIYPLRTENQQAIPLDVARPEQSFVLLNNHPANIFVPGSIYQFFSLSFVRIGFATDIETLPVGETIAYANSFYLPANVSMIMQIQHPAGGIISVMDDSPAPAVYCNKIAAWRALADLQQT